MALTGAHPMHLFRRWINKALDRHYSAASGVTPGS
jgi:hypothetical protein